MLFSSSFAQEAAELDTADIDNVGGLDTLAPDERRQSFKPLREKERERPSLKPRKGPPPDDRERRRRRPPPPPPPPPGP